MAQYAFTMAKNVCTGGIFYDFLLPFLSFSTETSVGLAENESSVESG